MRRGQPAVAGGTRAGAIRPVHVAWLLFLGFAWGSSFMFTAIGVRTIPPMTLTAARIVGAALMLWIVAWRMGLEVPRGARIWGLIALAGLNGNALPFALISWGQVRVDSSLAAILLSTAPLFTLPLMHFLTSDDRMDARKSLGIALGFAGVVMLIGVDALSEISGGFWGQLALVGAAMSFALTYLWARLLRAMSPVAVSAWVLLGSSLWSLPIALVVDRPWTLAPSQESVLAALALAVLSTGAANLVFFWLVSQTRPSFVSLTNYLLPAVGVMWGVLLLGESLPWRTLAALAVIVAGIALTSISKRSR